eukprot:488723_1
MDTSFTNIQTKIQEIADLYCISTIGIHQKLQTLKLVVIGAPECELLEYLLKSDLNPQRAADLYFNEYNKNNKYLFNPTLPIHPNLFLLNNNNNNNNNNNISLESPSNISTITTTTISPSTIIDENDTKSIDNFSEQLIQNDNKQIQFDTIPSISTSPFSIISNNNTKNQIKNSNSNSRKRQRKRKRSDFKRRSPRIIEQKMKCLIDSDCEMDNEVEIIYTPPYKKRKNKKNKIVKYDFNEATNMTIEILNEYSNEIMGRYQLLTKLQQKNNGKKWSESFQQNVGEFNEFLRKNDKLITFAIKLKGGINSRNFGVRTAKKNMEIMRNRHNLYESDSDQDCICQFKSK